MEKSKVGCVVSFLEHIVPLVLLAIVLVYISQLATCVSAAQKNSGCRQIMVESDYDIVGATWTEAQLWLLLKHKTTGKTFLKGVSGWSTQDIEFLQESPRQEQRSVLHAESDSTTATFTWTIPGATGTSK